MNTIMKISEAFKGFGDYIVQNNTLREGYVDILVLIGIACLTAIVLNFVERRT